MCPSYNHYNISEILVHVVILIPQNMDIDNLKNKI